MVDVDNLSDAELRTKLMEYGFPVMPITGTTRKVMVKKLKLLMENKNKISNDGRRSLTRYSSDDDSEIETKTSKRDKNRRLTAPPSALGSSSIRTPLRRSIRRNDNDIVGISETEGRPESKVSKIEAISSTKKVVKTVCDDFDTGSDSEPEIMDSEDRSKFENSRNFENRESPIKSTLSSYGFLNRSNYSPPKATESSPPSYGFSYTTSKPSSPRFSSYTSASSYSDDALERLNQIRSRLSLGSTAYDNKPSTTYTSIDQNNEESKTPFLSNFTKRLSQISANSPRTMDYGFKSDIIKENDTNGPSAYSRNYLARAGRYRDLGSRYQRQDSNMGNIVRNNLVSFTVVGVALLFFVLIGLMYLGMRSDSSALDTAGYVIPYCVSGNGNSVKGENCISDKDVMGAITLMKTIKPELENIALKNRCTDSSVKSYMSEQDIVNYILHIQDSRNPRSIEQDIDNLELLIFKNPEWGISVVEAVGKIVTEANVFENMKQVLISKAVTTVGLAVLNPTLPWKCIISNKISAILNTVIVTGGIFLLLYLSNLLYKYYKLHQERQKDEVFGMVERIIDILQSRSTDNTENNFIVINHVRDMIIPIVERKKKEKVWEKAIKFINENESRIRTEIQVVQGEPYEVWRWLGSHNLSCSESPRSKSWQGQAFETEVGSMNSLPCSPTPCLKIRGILDKEAILAKCAHQCHILHCAVDTNSKCVYLKCASQNDAAIAYRNLHGWWYAGSLVTVKYVRLERYMQRFPDSPASGPPFLKAASTATDWS